MIRDSFNALWDRWANWHPFVRFLILVGAAGVFAVFAVKPGYRAFKAWRVDRNLVAARKAVDEKRMNEARDLSLTVLQAGDPRIEAFRILEQSTSSMKDPRHGDIARALMTHPDSSAEDRWRGFAGIARKAPLGLVGQAWTQLPQESRSEPRFATAFADRLISEKRFSEAASVLLEVPEAGRAGEVERGLIRVLIGSGKKQGYDEAQRLIAAGFPNKAGDGSAWLDLLEEMPVMSLQSGILLPARRILEGEEWADSARASLTVARIDYAADFTGRAKIIDAAIAKWKDRDPEALAGFLADLGVRKLLLETLPPELVEKHSGLFVPLLEAMEDSGEWEKAGKLLDAHDQRLEKYELLMHRARVAAGTGDSPAFVQQWKAAMDEAKSDTSGAALLALHRFARSASLDEQANQAMVEAIRAGRGPLPLYADLKPILNALAQQGRENILLEICAIYLSFEPGNPVLLTQYAYLACLSNLVTPETIVKAMKPLADGFPKELPIQLVLATAYLCDGQPAKAAETIDRLKPDPDKLSPGYRAAFLTTQLLNRRIARNDPRV